MTRRIGKVTHPRISQQFRDLIIEDYSQLHKRPIQCRSLRGIFRDLIPELQRNEWGMFNPYEIYEVITTLFPELLTTVSERIGSHIHQYRYPLLSFWDYIEGKGEKKEILWEKIESPVLVFYNSGAPRIRRLHEKGEEYSTVKIGSTVYQEKIRKRQAFGSYIINKRYRLVGVITLEGVSEGSEGGSHYTSYYQGEDGWHHYNDIGPIIKKIDHLPSEGVWTEKGGRMPAMYFYGRVG